MTGTTTKWAFRLLPFGEKDCDPYNYNDEEEALEFLSPRLAVRLLQPTSDDTYRIFRWVVYQTTAHGAYTSFGAAVKGMLMCASTAWSSPRELAGVTCYKLIDGKWESWPYIVSTPGQLCKDMRNYNFEGPFGQVISPAGI
jgi:hypothetical protein